MECIRVDPVGCIPYTPCLPAWMVYRSAVVVKRWYAWYRALRHFWDRLPALQLYKRPPAVVYEKQFVTLDDSPATFNLMTGQKLQNSFLKAHHMAIKFATTKSVFQGGTKMLERNKPNMSRDNFKTSHCITYFRGNYCAWK